MPLSIRTILTVTAAILLTLATGLTNASAAESVSREDPITIVVVGYSTSHHWPGILQEMLDEHAGPGRYRVLNAAVGGCPVAKWLGRTGPRDRDRSFEKMVSGHFAAGRRSKKGRPTIALFQQSLQWIYGLREEGIRGPRDTERIEQGADAFAELAEQVHELGVEKIYLATHIYKRAMEPVIHNERFALDALMKRRIPYIHRGPELWEPTRRLFPHGFQRDQGHPYQVGAVTMAGGWYQTLLGSEARPELVERYLRTAADRPSPPRRRGR